MYDDSVAMIYQAGPIDEETGIPIWDYWCFI